MALIQELIEEETGAVTVDWVVLSAAMVGAVLAMTSLLGDGLEQATNNIDADLNAPSILLRMQMTFGYTPHDAGNFNGLMQSVSQLDRADLDQMAAFSNTLNSMIDETTDADTRGRAADLSTVVDIAYANADSQRTTSTSYDEGELARISSDLGYDTLAATGG